MMHLLVAMVFFWVIYLALFPILYFWLRLVWRVVRCHNYAEVALRKGVSPPNPRQVAPYFVALNTICSVVLTGVVLYVPIVGTSVIDWGVFAQSDWGDRLGVLALFPALAYQDATLFGGIVNWVAVAGSTIWIKIMLNWAITRQIHLKWEWQKKAQQNKRKA